MNVELKLSVAKKKIEEIKNSLKYGEQQLEVSQRNIKMIKLLLEGKNAYVDSAGFTNERDVSNLKKSLDDEECLKEILEEWITTL